MKQKNDRRDALKLAQLSARAELDLVHVPQTEVRQWRPLIAYRQHLGAAAHEDPEPRARAVAA